MKSDFEDETCLCVRDYINESIPQEKIINEVIVNNAKKKKRCLRKSAVK